MPEIPFQLVLGVLALFIAWHLLLKRKPRRIDDGEPDEYDTMDDYEDLSPMQRCVKYGHDFPKDIRGKTVYCRNGCGQSFNWSAKKRWTR